MKHAIAAVLVLWWVGPVAADIIEWRDADGVRHFTNIKAEVPAEEGVATRIVVDELARRQAASVTPPEPPAAVEPPRQAEAIYDRPQLSEAYLRGLARGLEAAGYITGGGGGGGGGVQINGPLAIARTDQRPFYDYYYPGYYPLVTTSFDRGRSRHLTLRLLLQDQFALDRAAPFVFEERLVPPFGYPPLGPDLNPVLPRGLPHGFPRDAQVIVR